MCDVLDMLIMTGANGRLGRVLAKTLAEAMQRKERAACARGTPSQRLQEDHPTTRPTLEITERVAHTLERVPAGDQTIEWESALSV
jgi:nucleoside-diphosphate-sugar epimerase